MADQRILTLGLILTCCIQASSRADETAPKLSDDQRAQLLVLARHYKAAGSDADARAMVVDTAIGLGKLGIQRLTRIVREDAADKLTRYGAAFVAQAQRVSDADAAGVVASNEKLAKLRAQLLEIGNLVVKLEQAGGGEASSPEEQLQQAERQLLRRLRLGPVLSQLSDEEIEAVKETNKQRKEKGLRPLEVDLKLTLAARDHSKDMATHGFFSHTSPVEGKSSFVDRARNFGANAASENIHAGAATGAAAVEAWMNSDGHRANLLTPGHRRIGIGHHDGHWTQLFGA